MSPGIFLVGEDGELVEMREQPYDSEAVLQELLERYPNLLAGDESSEDRPRRWILVKREAGVGTEADGNERWWVDHLFLDQDGVPTLVEVKRSTDSRIRRAVVGQMLDYAANALAYWPVERLQLAFEQTCAARGAPPEDVLAEVLSAGEDEEQFWTAVRTNLHAGRMRLVFVADLIPPELERVVEFLNRNMPSVDVVALEVKQYVGGVQTTLVSRVLGQSAATRQAKSVTRERRRWDEESFFTRAREVCEIEDVDVMRDILAWSRRHSLRLSWGRGKVEGSVFPALDHEGGGYWTFGLFTTGVIEIPFMWIQRSPPFDEDAVREALRVRINRIEGVALDEVVITKRPTFPVRLLRGNAELAKFYDAMEWILDTARKAHEEPPA